MSFSSSVVPMMLLLQLCPLPLVLLNPLGSWILGLLITWLQIFLFSASALLYPLPLRFTLLIGLPCLYVDLSHLNLTLIVTCLSLTCFIFLCFLWTYFMLVNLPPLGSSCYVQDSRTRQWIWAGCRVGGLLLWACSLISVYLACSHFAFRTTILSCFVLWHRRLGHNI